MKTLGLIGGTSWLSTVDYYRFINEGVAERLGGSQSARLLMYSFNFADILELTNAQNWDGVLERVSDAALRLEKAGAEGLVLCANTMHIVADRLSERVSIPIIHIVDATAAEIRKAGLDRVVLLGTRFTMEQPFFRDRLRAHGIESVVPDADDRAFIHRTIFEELGKERFLPETKARYLDIISSLEGNGVILGCTEIPLLIKPAECPVPGFDTTRIHANAAVEFSVGPRQVS